MRWFKITLSDCNHKVSKCYWEGALSHFVNLNRSSITIYNHINTHEDLSQNYFFWIEQKLFSIQVP